MQHGSPDTTTDSKVVPEQEPTVLFDVREEKEYKTSHIKDAYWINSLSDISEQQQIVSTLLKSKNAQEVIVYCSVGYRSAQLIEQLQKSQLQNYNFVNMEGGIFKWVNEGNLVTDNSNTNVCYVHPYNAVWGKLLDAKFRFDLKN